MSLRGHLMRVPYENQNLGFKYLNCTLFILGFVFLLLSSVTYSDGKLVFLLTPEYSRVLFLFSVPVWLDALSNIGGIIRSRLDIIFIILESALGSLIFIISFAGIFETKKLELLLLTAFWFSVLFVLIEIIRVVVATYEHFYRIKWFSKPIKLPINH